MGLWITHPSSMSSIRSQIASCVAAHAAMYSASIEDSATEVCWRDCQISWQYVHKEIASDGSSRVRTSGVICIYEAKRIHLVG